MDAAKVTVWSRAWWVTMVLVLAALTAWCGVASAGDFESANDLYDQGKFAEAGQRYEALVASGAAGANVYYNLANTQHRLGAQGRAVLNYERALTLSPGHPEALANVQLLRQQTGAKLPALSWIRKFFASRSLTVWIIGASIAGWLALFAGGLWVTTARADKGRLRLATLTGVVLFGFCGAAVWVQMKEEALAIITAKQTEARLAPAVSSGVAEALPAGSRVRVLSERGPWVYCELPGRGRGWVPQEAVERVRPAQS